MAVKLTHVSGDEYIDCNPEQGKTLCIEPFWTTKDDRGRDAMLISEEIAAVEKDGLRVPTRYDYPYLFCVEVKS